MNITMSKRLYRSRRQRIMAGICGGFAEYFNIDPIWIRLIFLTFFFLGLGVSLLIYGVLWFIIPKESRILNTVVCPKCHDDRYTN